MAKNSKQELFAAQREFAKKTDDLSGNKRVCSDGSVEWREKVLDQAEDHFEGFKKYKNGDMYEGTIRRGKKNSQSTTELARLISIEKRTIYIGCFKDDKFDGSGTLSDQSQDLFDGIFKEGNYWKGKGLLKKGDAVIFEGEFSEGKPWSGTGKFEDGKEEYNGQISEGKYHGKGKLTTKTGDTFAGEFQRGIFFRGQGKKSLQGQDYYEGSWDNGKYHGQGILKVKSKKFEGEFDNGVFPKGKIDEGNGNIYEGRVNDNKYHDKSGRATFQSQTESYTGCFENNLYHGEGSWSNPQGDVFQGSFSQGNFNGMGSLRKSSGENFEGEFKNKKYWRGKGKEIFENNPRNFFQGNWLDGKYHGQGLLVRDGVRSEGTFAVGYISSGTLTEANGDTYSGTFRGGKFHGQGKLIRKSGAHFEGEFRDGEYFAGTGKEIIQGNNNFFEGQWLNGKRHGDGMLFKDGKKMQGYFTNGELTNAMVEVNGMKYQGGMLNEKFHDTSGKATFTGKGSSYTGCFQSNMFHGQGELTTSDGDQYKGNFSQDRYDGDGVLTKKSGEQYSGAFKAGCYHGHGKLLRDGEEYVGSFDGGKRYGTGKLTYEDGSIWEGTMINDKQCQWGEGFGRFTSRDPNQNYEFLKNESKYVGTHQSGKMIWKNNTSYEGMVQTNIQNPFDKKQNGQGVTLYHDNSKHTGWYREGNYNGQGKLESTRLVYDGIWLDHLYHGQGHLKITGGDDFVGVFDRGLYQHGKLMKADGFEYEGNFVQGKPDGQGRGVFPDKSTFEGMWKEGKKKVGTWTKSDGTTIEGKFRKDKPVGCLNPSCVLA